MDCLLLVRQKFLTISDLTRKGDEENGPSLKKVTKRAKKNKKFLAQMYMVNFF